MEKLKNLLSSHKDKNEHKDEHRGEGSHFDNARETETTHPTSQGSGVHDSSLNPASQQAAHVATGTNISGQPSAIGSDTQAGLGHPTTGSNMGISADPAASTLPEHAASTSSTGHPSNLASELAAGNTGAGLTAPQGSRQPGNPFFGAGNHTSHTQGPHQSELPHRPADQSGVGSSQPLSGMSSHQGSGVPTQSGQISSALPSERGDDRLTGQGSHLGRDAAIGTGVAAGIARHEHQSGPQNERGDDRLTGQGSHLGRDAAIETGVGAGIARHEHQSGLRNERGDDRLTGQGSHLGRDTAVGTGAEIASRKHQQHGISGLGSGAVNPAGTQGHHTTAVANLLDPNLNSTARTGTEDAHHHDPEHGGGAEEADLNHSGKSGCIHPQRSNDDYTSAGHHHRGRDEALGAAGAGLAAHEIGQQHASHGTHQPHMTSTGNQGIAPGSSGMSLSGQPGSTGLGSYPEASRLANENLGTTTSTREPMGGRSNDPSLHTGREFSLGAGAMGAGTALHEHSRPHNTNQSTLGSSTQPSGGIYDNTSSSHHHAGRDAGVVAGGAALAGSEYEQRYDPSHSTRESATHSSRGLHDNTSSSQHHLGRDAGLAAGVGGLAEHESRKHHESNLHDDPNYLVKDSTTNPAKGVYVDPESSKHHHGKEAGLAAGSGALAEHEARKHHDSNSGETHDSSGSIGPHKHAWMNKLDPRVNNAADHSSDSSSKTHDDKHHLGRDAAIAGGATGAAYKFDESRHPHRVTDSNDPALTEADFDAQGNRITHPRSNAEPALEKLEDTVSGHHSGSRNPSSHEGLGSTSHTSGMTHPGRDVTAMGGAGALAEHEGLGYSGSGNTTGLGRSGYEDTTGVGSTSLGHHGSTSTDQHGHTKLHKEPPAAVRQELAGGRGGLMEDERNIPGGWNE